MVILVLTFPRCMKFCVASFLQIDFSLSNCTTELVIFYDTYLKHVTANAAVGGVPQSSMLDTLAFNLSVTLFANAVD